MRKQALESVYDLAKKDPRVYFIGSDLGVGTLDKFRKEMPDRFLMEGISEANVVGMASGLAIEGKIAYVNTIATFLSRRACEQIVLDMCLHNANVRLIGNGGGLVYAPLGPTHLAIEDLAICRAIPNLTVIAPADAPEMKRAVEASIHHPGPMYFRVAKGGDPLVSRDDLPFKIGRPILMAEPGEAIIITTGITLKLALDAAVTLAGEGIQAGILHLHTLKPVELEPVMAALAKPRVVVTIEEHVLNGGLGSLIAEIIAEAGYNPSKRFKRIGLPDQFPDQYGSQASLMKRFSITTERLLEVVRGLLKNK